MVHGPQLDIAHDVIDVVDVVGARAIDRDELEPRQERITVVGAIDEPVNRLPVGGDVGEPDAAVVVLDRARFADPRGSPLGGFVVGAVDVRH